MEQNNLENLGKEKLALELKKRKKQLLISQFLIGLLIGVSIYSYFVKGFTWPTFFPWFFVILLIGSGAKTTKIINQLKKSNLK